MFKMNNTEARNYVVKQFYVPMSHTLSGETAQNILQLQNFLKEKGFHIRADEYGRVQICDREFNLIAQNICL